MLLTDREPKIGDTQFYIRKIPAWEAYPFGELFRETFFNALNLDTANLTPDSESMGIGIDSIASIVQVIMGIDKDVIETLKIATFKYVQFDRGDGPKRSLEGNENEAFDDFIQIYDLLARTITINFLEYTLKNDIPRQIVDSIGSLFEQDQ